MPPVKPVPEPAAGETLLDSRRSDNFNSTRMISKTSVVDPDKMIHRMTMHWQDCLHTGFEEVSIFNSDIERVMLNIAYEKFKRENTSRRFVLAHGFTVDFG